MDDINFFSGRNELPYIIVFNLDFLFSVLWFVYLFFLENNTFYFNFSSINVMKQ